MTRELDPSSGEDTTADAESTFRRVSGPEDLARVTDTVNLAFSGDPTWAPLLAPVTGELDASLAYWSLFTRSAQRYPWSFTNAGGTVASIWYPPGAEELTAEEEAGFPAFVRSTLPSERAEELLVAVERFDAARPAGDYAYLSLLAVHPDRRGHGLGMRLLADNLRELDALGVASYLESSNPANDAKYRRLGYEPHGSIELPSGLTLTTMWRDAGRS